MITILLWLSESVPVGDSRAIDTGGAASLGSGSPAGKAVNEGVRSLVAVGTEAFMADPDGSPTTGESGDERSACRAGSLISASLRSCGPSSCDSKPSLVTGRATSRPAKRRSSRPPRVAEYDVAAVESRRGLSPA